MNKPGCAMLVRRVRRESGTGRTFFLRMGVIDVPIGMKDGEIGVCEGLGVGGWEFGKEKLGRNERTK